MLTQNKSFIIRSLFWASEVIKNFFKQDMEKLYQVKDEEIYSLNLSNRSFFAVQEYSIF